MRSFGVIRIRINNARLLVSWSKEPANLLWVMIHMHRDPSDLGLLILIRNIPKERTLEPLTELLKLNTYFTSKIANAFRTARAY